MVRCTWRSSAPQRRLPKFPWPSIQEEINLGQSLWIRTPQGLWLVLRLFFALVRPLWLLPATITVRFIRVWLVGAHFFHSFLLVLLLLFALLWRLNICFLFHFFVIECNWERSSYNFVSGVILMYFFTVDTWWSSLECRHWAVLISRFELNTV